MPEEMDLPEPAKSPVPWLDGVVFISVNGRGVWGALRDARKKLRELRVESTPRMVFVQAMDGDGRAVTLLDPRVAALMVGYRLETT